MIYRIWDSLARVSRADALKVGLVIVGLGLAALYGVLPLLVTFYAIDRKPLPGRPTSSPSDFGFDTAEDVTLSTQDGMRIAAWWLPGEPGQATVIMAHGRGSCRAALLGQATLFSALGCHVLMLDLRAHGDSQGRWVSWGRLEANDLLAAVSSVRQSQRQTHPILLYGFSLGAQAALHAAAHCPEIAGVIAVAPGLSLKSWFERQFKRRTGLPTPPGLYSTFALLARLRSGIAYDQTSLDLVARVAEIEPLPLLIICGERDWMATPADARRLHVAARQAEVVVIPSADHLGTLYDDPQRYCQAVTRFMARVAPRDE